LSEEVKMWPTPTSSKHKYRLRGNSQQSKSLAALAGGQLSPKWVEWLMGFPLGWTDFEHSGTPASPRNAPALSANCGGG